MEGGSEEEGWGECLHGWAREVGGEEEDVLDAVDEEEQADEHLARGVGGGMDGTRGARRGCMTK